MSLNVDQKDVITECKLCTQSFDSWSDERIRLHLESCSERKARLLIRCPSCSKALSKGTALKHTKVCANFLNISLFNLLFLNGDVLPDTFSSSKSSRPSKTPKSKPVPNLKTNKKTFKSKVVKGRINTVDHLLISSADRQKIFANRLSDILHKEHFAWSLSEDINCQSRYSSPLWDLSSLPPENKSEQFYVDSLSNLVTPSRKMKINNPLRMSQIPGRSPSSLKKIRLTQAAEHVKQPTNSECNNLLSEMLLKMVGTPLCSDLLICLDSGESVPAHRFILAAWNSELALITDNAYSITAPGLNKEELLNLLRALYTFDLSYFSSLSPEAEFTLDCWQMLDIVKNKFKADATSRLSITPKVQDSTGVRGSTLYNSGVDLFASEVAENTNPCSPRTSFNPKAISPSSTDAIQVGDKSLQSSVNVDALPQTVTSCDSVLPPTPVLFKPNMLLAHQSTPCMPLALKTATTEMKQPKIITASSGADTTAENEPEKSPLVLEPAPRIEAECVTENISPKADASPLIFETSSTNTVEAVIKQMDIELKKSSQLLEHALGNEVEMIIEQRDIRPEESSLSRNAVDLDFENERSELDSSPLVIILSPRNDIAEADNVMDLNIENVEVEPEDSPVVVDLSCNNAMEMDIQNPGGELGEPSSTKHNEANAEDIDNMIEEPQLLLVSSPRNEEENENDKPFTQSPCHSVDLDPPSFGGGFEQFQSFEAEEHHVPLSAQKRSSGQLDLEDQEASSRTLVELEPAPPAVSSDSVFFSDASAPTPAPLAKRLRASAETTEETEAVFFLSSQPLLDHHSDKENSYNKDENYTDLHVSFSLSQPTPCTPVANKRRVTSVILTDVPITPKPAFEAMSTPELRKALSEYGIRRLPRKKAVQLLNHIYDELHPYVEVPTVTEENEASEKDHNNKENSSASSVQSLPPVREMSVSAHRIFGGISNSESEFQRPASTQNIFEGASTSENETSSSSQQVSSGKIKTTPEEENNTLKARIWECLRRNDQLYYNIITYVPLELDCVKTMLRNAGINVGLRRLSDFLDSWGVTFTTRNRHTAKPGMDTSDPTSSKYLW